MGQLTKQFGKINVTLPIPHLLNLQIDSYSKFLQEGVAEADRNKEEGLEGVFHTVFPIEDFNKTASLEFVSYEIREPKYDQAECISKGLTYEAPVHIKVRLVVYDTDEATGNRTIRDIKEQGIYFGTLPLMTEKGTFIINGTERVVVSQLVRSPGVYFSAERDKTSDKTIYNAKIIPSRGAWLEFETDKRDLLSVRIDRKRKQPATLLVRALGLAETREEIIELLQQLQKERKLAYLFICHNIALVQQFCDRVIVLHDGRIVESGLPDEVILHPQSDYTRRLVDAVF